METKEPKQASGTQSVANTKSETKLASLSPTIKSRSSKLVQALFRDDSVAGQRAKRRRTSPQDHAVLEAAYLRNSKPDKTERAQIVNDVHLGEKEVQIWFQNRRQNDRRRSKPLDAYDLDTTAQKSHTPPVNSQHSKHDRDDVDDSHLSASHHAHPSPTLSNHGSPTSPRRSRDATDKVNQSSVDDPLTNGIKALHTPPSSMEEIKSVSVENHEATKVSKDNCGESTPGSARKRDLAEMSGDSQVDSRSSTTLADFIPIKSKEPIKRSSSVRLSMTAEGAVKIRTNDEPTPSPPKERPLPPTRSQTSQTKIQRSISLSEDPEIPQVDQSSEPRLLNAGFGRSRDARTWEFYCDNSATDALSTQVEAERNGSAVGAINLIRSNSRKSRGFPAPMSPSLAKRNAQLGAAKSKAGKPKMMRAKSSLARLQSSEQDAPVLKQSSKQGSHVRSPSGDSDKENWAPGTRISDNPLRRTQPTNNRRPVLQSNGSATFRDARPQSNTAGKASIVKTGAGGDDLDCIHGLLSLSQGAWR